ncbi:hypothetical protein VPH70E373_0206 [Vibrio phage 70E37-3]
MAYRSFWEVYGIIKKLARYFPSQESCQLFSRQKLCQHAILFIYRIAYGKTKPHTTP